MSDFLQPHELQHARPPCPSPTPGVHPNSFPLSQWCHPTISSSVVPFSSCLQSFPASGSFQMSQLFTSGGQSIGVSASTSVLPVNTQDWSSLGWTGWISLQSKGLSRVFSFRMDCIRVPKKKKKLHWLTLEVIRSELLAGYINLQTICVRHKVFFCFFLFNWSIVALQCSISFYYTLEFISYMCNIVPDVRYFLKNELG